jgi:bifunctional non-homologous end joining protein LigD
VNGCDVTRVGLRQRKAILRRLLAFRDPLRFTPHRNADGEAYWRQACRKGWEGVVAKRADAPYRHDRSGDWLKFKCVNQQEFVIGGFTDPKGSRHGFGALLLGYYRGGDLVYAGKVGTGFNDELLERLGRRLASLERARPPFALGATPQRGGALGMAGTGRPDRLQRMDRRRAAAPSPVPGSQARQAPA